MSIKKNIMPAIIRRCKKCFSCSVIFLIFLHAPLLGGESYSERGWEFFHERGMKQFNAGMYRDAWDSMVKALKRNPSSFESANILAEIALLRKERNVSIEYLEKSLAVNDRQSGAHNRLGELLEFSGRDDEAFIHFKKAYELDNVNLRAMVNYSRHLRKRGDKGEADRLFSLCSDTAINSSRPLLEKGRSLTGHRPSEAESLYLKAIEINPAYVEAYIALADLHRQERRYEKAAMAMEELKRLKSDYAPAYFYLGNIYYNNRLKGNTRARWINLAVKNIEEGLKLDPSSVDDWFHLAEIYRQLGETDKAVEREKRGVELMKERKEATQ